MSFSDFIRLFHTFMKSDVSRDEFVIEFTNMIMEEPTTEQDKQKDADDERNPLSKLKPNSLEKIYNGGRDLSKRDASFFLSHLDKDVFCSYLEEGTTVDSMDSIIKELNEKGFKISEEHENAYFDCAEVFQRILSEIAKKERKASPKKGADSTSPDKTAVSNNDAYRFAPKYEAQSGFSNVQDGSSGAHFIIERPPSSESGQDGTSTIVAEEAETKTSSASGQDGTSTIVAEEVETQIVNIEPDVSYNNTEKIAPKNEELSKHTSKQNASISTDTVNIKPGNPERIAKGERPRLKKMSKPKPKRCVAKQENEMETAFSKSIKYISDLRDGCIDNVVIDERRKINAKKFSLIMKLKPNEIITLANILETSPDFKLTKRGLEVITTISDGSKTDMDEAFMRMMLFKY